MDDPAIGPETPGNLRKVSQRMTPNRVGPTGSHGFRRGHEAQGGAQGPSGGSQRGPHMGPMGAQPGATGGARTFDLTALLYNVRTPQSKLCLGKNVFLSIFVIDFNMNLAGFHMV